MAKGGRASGRGDLINQRHERSVVRRRCSGKGGKLVACRGAIGRGQSDCSRLVVRGSALKQQDVCSLSDTQRVLTIKPLPRGFSLGATVCSYGWAMLAPNVWRPSRPRQRLLPSPASSCGDVGGASAETKDDPKRENKPTMSPIPRRQSLGAGCRPGWREGELERPLRLANGCAVRVVIRQPTPRRLEVHVLPARPRPGRVRVLSSQDLEALRGQVLRMLRLRPADSETQIRFAARSQTLAKRNLGVGRLFRSPSFFEDIVKTFTLCNCGWNRTLAMNELLCKEFGGDVGAFPTPEELVLSTAKKLQRRCRVGYRAERLLRLAKAAVRGDPNLEALGAEDIEESEALERSKTIHGLGPFGCANVLQLLGHYGQIPADSETVRHLRQAHGIGFCTKDNVREVADRLYSRYSPFQFLRYWTELWQTYEDRMGGLAYEVDPAQYQLAAGPYMNAARQPYAIPLLRGDIGKSGGRKLSKKRDGAVVRGQPVAAEAPRRKLMRRSVRLQAVGSSASGIRVL
eukprot:TRINITY_DN43958_c0_g1_i1.p1 TRINITY_DN43958_c0_g1~~TRINITY_DN43958_c0_g1_i1.p1  ORF type:complete len:529 (-),score=72.47 TRINITY_DN43958_c0_g1_i1:145-1692(-)